MIKEFLALFLICLFASACDFSTVPKQNNSIKNVESILIENVDAETNGKRFGDTHFSLNSNELFLSYTYFDTNEMADSKLRERKNAAKQILSTEPVVDKDGNKIGEKFVAVFDSNEKEKRFCLLWTKGSKITEVSAESLEAIKDFEQTYKI